MLKINFLYFILYITVMLFMNYFDVDNWLYLLIKCWYGYLWHYENHELLELFLINTEGGLDNFFAELMYAFTNFLLILEDYFFSFKKSYDYFLSLFLLLLDGVLFYDSWDEFLLWIEGSLILGIL